MCGFRFTADPAGLLLATDVAARGLDIPQVQHVIHYQVPKNSEVGDERLGFHCQTVCLSVCLSVSLIPMHFIEK